MDPTARLLRLLALLQTYRHWEGEELADRLRVSARTVRRDVDRLRELGYPVDGTRGAHGGYRLRAGAQIPPLLLDDEEAVAIAVGLRTAAHGAVAGLEETAVRALAKLQQVLPAPLRRRVEAVAAGTMATAGWTGDAVDADVLVALAQACRASEQVRFAYTAADTSQTPRLVEPHRLVVHYRRWYLIAWDVQRAGWRTFRADRIERPFANGVRIRPRELPAQDAAAFLDASLRSRPQAHTAVLRLHATADDAQRSIAPWMGDITDSGDGTCTLRATSDSLPWLTAVLAMLDIKADPVEVSPELGAHLEVVSRRLGHLASTQVR